jgi:uncharacterized protein YdhG (YjbR/CyaY superfamily)
VKITTVDDFIKHKVAPEHKATVASLRKLMKKYAPDAKEGISYGILGWKQKRMLAVINPTKNGITFAFARGAYFTDKYGLLQGVGKISKHVKITSLADINNTALRDYIKQAVEFQDK